MVDDTDIQLADLLESYPSVTTSGFQTLISAKKEFKDMASQIGEKLPEGKGQYFKHQKFFHRFLRSYDELFDLSATGVGKSCSILGFIEYTIKERMKRKMNAKDVDEKVAHFDKILILVKNKNQKNELKNQIICKCSDGHYLTDLVEDSKDAVQARNISREIKKAGYKIDTARKFAKSILEDYPTKEFDQKLADDFADTIFWVDEAHNLIIDPGKDDEAHEKERVYKQLWRVFHLSLRRKVILSTATPMINDQSEIGWLMNLILPANGILPKGYDYLNISDKDFTTFFPNYPYNPRTTDRNTWLNYFRQLYPYDHNLQNNDVDLLPYIRRDLEKYFRGQFPKDYNFKTATLQDLEPYFRGRIGYIRATNTGAIPEEQGEIIRTEFNLDGVKFTSNLVADISWMSDFQTEVYLNAMKSSGGRDDLYGGQRQASNFVFPDETWGNGITDEERRLRKTQKDARKIVNKEDDKLDAPREPINSLHLDTEANEQSELFFIDSNNFQKRGFRRYVELIGDNVYRATPEFASYISTLDNIGVLSCKYKSIIENVMYQPGNCFVYGEFVKGSGAIVLGLCLEQLGFTRYNENSTIFSGGEGRDSKRKLCPSNEKKLKEERKARIPKGLRYALLTGDTTTDAKFISMMETMNSYENRHGDYIKVLISSKSGRDGINVNNVLQIHLIGPEWNQSSMYQAVSRGIRATSHEDLIKEEEIRIASQGGDPNSVKIDIKVFRHAAISTDESESSIDLQMYQLSEVKDRGIKRIMRIMKQCAIGCQINKRRNIRQPPDVDGSPECDYDICDYECVDPDPDPDYTDYSTYDVVYANDEISKSMESIIKIFKTDNAFTIEDIISLLKNERKKFIIIALEKIITEKIPLIDRFGYISYLREDNSTFYLDRNYPSGTEPSYAMSYYTKGIIAIQKNSLENIVTLFESSEYEQIFNELENMDPNDPSFYERLSSISIEGQALILEEAIKRQMMDHISPVTEAVTQKYNLMIFIIHDPISELEKEYENLSDNKRKRGRKRNPEIKRRMKKINPSKINETENVEDSNAEQVVIHTLYSLVTNQTGYSVTSRFNKGEGRTRIIKPSEFANGWRDINQFELPVYNKIIQNEMAKKKKVFEDKGIYGFVLLSDGEFRIRDRLTEDEAAKDDSRKIKKGKKCKTWHRPDLIDVMWEIGIDEPEGNFQNFTEEDRETLINTLLNTNINKNVDELSEFPLDKLSWYYKWYISKRITRELMCDIIKNKMIEDGRFLD